MVLDISMAFSSKLLKKNQQVEVTDIGYMGIGLWELCYPDPVGFGGKVEHYELSEDDSRVRWVPDKHVVAVPYDVLQAGYKVDSCAKIRLWRADAIDVFDFYAFNIGDYIGSVEDSVRSETISKILYPNDETDQGKELRLKQQFFFVSASLQDMIRNLKERNLPIEEFYEHYQVQLNDTHPSMLLLN